MVYEQFKSSADKQTNNIDSARIIEELGTASLASALQDSGQAASQAAANQIFGSVFFVGAELPDQPATKPDSAKADGVKTDSGKADGSKTDAKVEGAKPSDATIHDPDREIIDQLQPKYGIHVLRVITPSKVEAHIYQNDKLQFSTEGKDLEAELKKQGMHELKDLGFDKDSTLSNYFDYVKRHYGFNSIHIIQGSGSTFYFYDRDGKKVSEGSVLDLQNHIEKNGLSANDVDPPSKKTITHMPNGLTAIEYPDGSEVLLGKDKQIARYITPRGDVIKPENAEGTKWRTKDGSTLDGKLSFSPSGAVTFEFSDTNNPLAKRTYSPPKGVEDTYRDGLKVSYSDGAATKVQCSDGATIAMSNEQGAKAYSIMLKDGRGWNVKEEASGKLVSNDPAKELPEADQISLQKRLGDVYEKIGKTSDAIKHHQIVTNAAELQYTPGSLELVPHHKHLAELKLKLNDTKGAEWHTKEVNELNRVSDYLGRVKAAPDDLMRMLLVTNALPSNLKLDTAGKVIRFEFNDAGKALEAIPGLRLPGTRDLSGIKAISLEGNQLKFEGEGTFKFKVPNTDIIADFKLSNASCDISCDPKDPTRLKLSNFKGLSVSAFGANLQPEHLILSTSKNQDGTDTFKIEFGKLIPAVAAEKKPGAKDIAKDGLALLIGSQVPDIPPVSFPMPSQVRLDRLFSEALNWAKAGDAKDAGKMFESIVGLYGNTEISNVFTDIKEMKKTGDRIEISTAGRNLYSIGGLPLSWDAKVSADFKQDGTKISLSNIEGARVKLVLPGDVANGLGIKNPMEIAFKEISLSEPDKEGNRIATIRTDSILESVSIKVGPKFEPIRDKQGKITLDANLKRDDARASIKITANPEQLSKGDPANIEFALNVTGGSDKIAQILQGFMGHELDPTVKELLNGVESVTKVGDQITINRKGDSVHEKSGLKVHVAKAVSFKIDPKATNLELKDITGINIVDLPDVAGKIYAHKMPITMRYLSLSNANQAGERVLTMKADGVVSSATIYLDASMKPKEIIAVVENPAKYLKESWGNRDFLAQKLDRATKGKSYAIRIKGDGSVDLDGLGGVGGVADMLLNGGDLVSVEGVAATVVGYVGTSATQGSAAANRGLGDKIVETFQGIFGK